MQGLRVALSGSLHARSGGRALALPPLCALLGALALPACRADGGSTPRWGEPVLLRLEAGAERADYAVVAWDGEVIDPLVPGLASVLAAARTRCGTGQPPLTLTFDVADGRVSQAVESSGPGGDCFAAALRSGRLADGGSAHLRLVLRGREPVP